MKHVATMLRIAVAIVLVSLLVQTHIIDGVAAVVSNVRNQLAPAISKGDRNGLNP